MEWIPRYSFGYVLKNQLSQVFKERKENSHKVYNVPPMVVVITESETVTASPAALAGIVKLLPRIVDVLVVLVALLTILTIVAATWV